MAICRKNSEKDNQEKTYFNKPAVILESTIITHGMPYPTNVEVALDVEEEVRKQGAIPLTTAFINGELKVGLTKEEIEYLGKAKGVVKASRRDIGYVVANKLDASTTVACTMIIAKKFGIKVFATGGIGGVHRDGENTMDISADLEEFSKSNVNVICAGPKAILDVGRTLEYLETKGIAVIGYQTDTVPLFYTRESEYKCEQTAFSVENLAQIIKCNDEFGLNQGSLILNPIPNEDSLDSQVMNKAIDEALVEMNKKGISGKEVTPFLLSKVVDLTKGKSLESNISLIKNNARLAGKLAVELCKFSSF